MNLDQAIITGFVQGLTEFLPVSSSGHIVLVSSLYKLATGQSLISGGNEEIFFDIMLHFGTLIAVLIYFRADIKHLIMLFFSSIKDKTIKTNKEAQIPIFIVIGTIATVFIAYPLKDFFEELVYSPSLVGIVLILTGTILASTEYISSKIPVKTDEMSFKKSLIIGVAQGLAVAPGLSRSGSTIAAGLALGLDRVTCARYSFLLSIPIIIAAALFHSLDLIGAGELQSYNWTAILTGTIIAGVVGFYCIKYFIKFISKHNLNVFAYYCWFVGAGMFLYFNFIK